MGTPGRAFGSSRTASVRQPFPEEPLPKCTCVPAAAPALIFPSLFADFVRQPCVSVSRTFASLSPFLNGSVLLAGASTGSELSQVYKNLKEFTSRAGFTGSSSSSSRWKGREGVPPGERGSSQCAENAEGTKGLLDREVGEYQM